MASAAQHTDQSAGSVEPEVAVQTLSWVELNIVNTSWQQFLSAFNAENERLKTVAKIAKVKRINDAANRETAWHDQQWQIKQERMKQERIEAKQRRQVEYLTPLGIDEGLKGHSIYDYGRDVDWRTEEPAKLQRDLP